MKRGYMDWDKQLLPFAVLEERRSRLMRTAVAEGAVAVVIYGDVYSADQLSYYVNYGPYWCNSAAVLTAREIYMVTGHNNRVNPWISSLTGIGEEKLLASGFRVPAVTAGSLRERFPEGGRVGVAGKYAPADLVKELEKANFEVVIMDRAASALLETGDQAYRDTAARGAEILREAFAAGDREYEAGGTSKTTAAEIEYSARKNGAMDIAIYVSYRETEFGLPERQEDSGGRWSVYALMQYLGVWVSFGKTYGCSVENIRRQLEHRAVQLLPGLWTEIEGEGYRVTVKPAVADTASELNAPLKELRENQVVCVCLEEPGGLLAADMFVVTEKGAVAL